MSSIAELWCEENTKFRGQNGDFVANSRTQDEFNVHVVVKLIIHLIFGLAIGRFMMLMGK
ncbi:MAG: hypothetical protein L3J20_03725 [Flavobacteriaceae bacterium]|nr:hypothetical protein [Flavobacteriaceae bacterium]